MDMMQHGYEGNPFPSQHDNYYCLHDHHRADTQPTAPANLASHHLAQRPPAYTPIPDIMPYHTNDTSRNDDAYGAAAAAATAEADCYPSDGEFESIVQNYLRNLSSKKRDKALVDRRRYSLIVRVLKDPRNTAISTAQFRFWVKKMFQLVPLRNGMDVVCHDSKPVAMREEIYSILVRAHKEANHGGRDKTSALVRRRYSWIPKELIARFVRHCPFCISRRNGSQSPTIGLVPKTPPDYALDQAPPPINAHGGVPPFLPLRHQEMVDMNKPPDWQTPCGYEPHGSSTPTPTHTADDVVVGAAVPIHSHDATSPVRSFPTNYDQRSDVGPVSGGRCTNGEGGLSSSSSCAVAPAPPPPTPSDSLNSLYQISNIHFVTDPSVGGHQHVDAPPYMCYEKGQVYQPGRTPPPRHPHQHHQQHQQQDDYYFPTATYLACDHQPRRSSQVYSVTNSTPTSNNNNNNNNNTHSTNSASAAAAAAAVAFMFPSQLSSPSPSSSFSSSSSTSVSSSSVLSSPISPPPSSSPSNQLSFAPAYHYMQPSPTSQPNSMGVMGQPF
ncbi:hypothetical protein BCR43DRAFT_547874 [Syncephalastrum racemosum]|uniref:Integrase zinc-binding domain-containing protein n=1 Tax=Syncephalastrum racemosum TaxID=13706 RepID=A0A1X2HCS0_SYNRA|nr:hypothetical protein BCR43DRAFT_547874 [Syncephalastrum racemosum]